MKVVANPAAAAHRAAAACTARVAREVAAASSAFAPVAAAHRRGRGQLRSMRIRDGFRV